VRVFNASTISEIDTAFTGLVRERTDALFVAPDAFFNLRRDRLDACPTGSISEQSNPFEQIEEAEPHALEGMYEKRE
jgi:hypothetical protein